MYKKLVLPFLFQFDAEQVHHFVCRFIKISFQVPFVPLIFRKLYGYDNPVLKRTVFGLTFKNPVGLAAGFDKNADLVDELSDMGFGFIEIGTVTPVAQDGNPKPRLFRLKPDNALINRMGFNNEGVKAAAQRLRNRNSKLIIGGNIGKNKLTPNENALDDYIKCFDELHDVVDYFVVNVSSPNTPNLRELQEKEPLKKILSALKVLSTESWVKRKNKIPTTHDSQPTTHDQPKPILLKIAPDLTNSQLDDIVEIVIETGIAGVIATNTTISRSDLVTDDKTIEQIGAGGLSGAPLAKRSTDVIRYLCQQSNNAFPVIGVGGIASADDAIEKLAAGASLVQIYTGFIYEGPSIAKQINTEIALRGV